MGNQKQPSCIRHLAKIKLGKSTNEQFASDIQQNQAWEQKLNKYGSLFGYMMPNSTGIRVKALQEVIPALENAKNILFAQEIGLKIGSDAVAAALPIANQNQLIGYRGEIHAAVKSAQPNWEALRVIASHQYHGVTFFRADKDSENLTLIPKVRSVAVGSSYNQTQQ